MAELETCATQYRLLIYWYCFIYLYSLYFIGDRCLPTNERNHYGIEMKKITSSREIDWIYDDVLKWLIHPWVLDLLGGKGGGE